MAQHEPPLHSHSKCDLCALTSIEAHWNAQTDVLVIKIKGLASWILDHVACVPLYRCYSFWVVALVHTGCIFVVIFYVNAFKPWKVFIKNVFTFKWTNTGSEQRPQTEYEMKQQHRIERNKNEHNRIMSSQVCMLGSLRLSNENNRTMHWMQETSQKHIALTALKATLSADILFHRSPILNGVDTIKWIASRYAHRIVCLLTCNC